MFWIRLVNEFFRFGRIAHSYLDLALVIFTRHRLPRPSLESDSPPVSNWICVLKDQLVYPCKPTRQATWQLPIVEAGFATKIVQ